MSQTLVFFLKKINFCWRHKKWKFDIEKQSIKCWADDVTKNEMKR